MKVKTLNINPENINLDIRRTTRADTSALRSVLDDTELFPSEMLDDMHAESLKGDPPALWFTALVDGQPIGFVYAAAEALTDGAWNMLAIGVRAALQGRGVGGALSRHLERFLRDAGHRILIADTSGTDRFAATREFYRKAEYTEEARIRDFWGEGDDKVTFRKAL